MERVIISKENIKPSSPTPQHLQVYRLSMLDQVVPSMLVPVVLYFPAGPVEPYQVLQRLKCSLSVMLTRFYPLAGKASVDGQSIDCDDSGVPFVVVKFTGHKLMDLLKEPGQDLPGRLLPFGVAWNTERCPDSSIMMVQVSCFECGGMAIGAVFWHKAVDAAAIGNFLQAWAGTCQGSWKGAVCPNYIAQSLFPHRDDISSQFGSISGILKTGKSIMRRYVFHPWAISFLKAKSGVKNPTRVEVVSALIWKRFMAASLANGNPTSLLTHAVNLRRRAQPFFPSDCFGNFPGLAAATASNVNNDDMGYLVTKMRDAISKIDSDYVNRMVGDEGLSGYHGNLGNIWGDIPQDADLLSISSWCGFGLYNIDFGWGKPVWITRCDAGNDLETCRFLNVVWLMDTKGGDGIEAWIILDEKYMMEFDKLEEFRALAAIDPTPLEY